MLDENKLTIVLSLLLLGLVLRVGYERGLRHGMESAIGVKQFEQQLSTKGAEPAAVSLQVENLALAQPRTSETPPSEIVKPPPVVQLSEAPALETSVPLTPTPERRPPPAANNLIQGRDPNVEKMKRLADLQTSCPMLQQVRSAIVAGMCDICELLPLLEAYADEVDRFVEAGSRHGSSTTVLLNKHIKEFSSMEIDVQPPLQKLHDYATSCARGHPDHSANQIIPGDDVTRGLPYKETPILFIDTLHNADQLYKELETLTLPVTQWIVFHDSYSFLGHDEAPIRRKDVPPVVSGWRGLAAPIRHFLEKYKDEWMEEMNFQHCNGFFVMRKRSFKLKIHPPFAARLDFYNQKAAALSWTGSAMGVLQQMSHMRSWHEPNCNGVFKTATGSHSGMLCAGRHQHELLQTYTGYVAAYSGSVPLLDKIGYVYGVAFTTDLAAFVYSGVPGVEGALEMASLIAASSALLIKSKPFRVYCLNGKTDAVEALRQQLPFAQRMEIVPIYDLKDFSSSGGRVSPLPYVFLSASTARMFTLHENFQAEAKIVVVGTQLADVTSFAPTGFDLQVALNAGTGLAVWERTGSLYAHYFTPGSAPPLVSDVPRSSHTYH